jgi:hypothetical protein
VLALLSPVAYAQPQPDAFAQVNGNVKCSEFDDYVTGVSEDLHEAFKIDIDDGDLTSLPKVFYPSFGAITVHSVNYKSGSSGDIKSLNISTSFDAAGVMVKGGSGSSGGGEYLYLATGAIDKVTYTSPNAFGLKLNSGGKDKVFGISHIEICVSTSGSTGGTCDTHPSLKFDNDEVDRTNRTVSNTIRDPNGVQEYTFTLKNFNIDSIPSTYAEVPDSDDSSTSETEVTYIFDGGGVPDTEVPFTLRAPNTGDATYFVSVTNGCGNETRLDPPYTFDAPIPTTLAMEGSYPNPFRASTTIDFTLPETTPVTLNVYDVLGRRVTTLIDRDLTSGTHTVTWNGETDGGIQLSSGLYLLRLQAGQEIRTQRVSLIR